MFFLIICFLFLSALCYFWLFPQSMSTIIIINGPSSSGKSATTAMLEELYNYTYLKMGVDEYTALLLPKKLLNYEPSQQQPTAEGMQFIRQDDQQGPKIVLSISPYVKRVFFSMPYCVNVLAQKGFNIIVDAGLTNDIEWLATFVRALKGHTVYFIKLKSSLDVLEKRETERKGFQGLARGQLEVMNHIEKVYPVTFDLELDCEKLNPRQRAEEIRKFIENNPKPHAFKSMLQHISVMVPLTN
jgi:chloramphenicol 3-O phosphotransferase